MCDKNKKALESKEELYFSWWLNDLKKIGIVKSYTHNVTPFTITEGYFIEKIKPMKRVPDKILKKTIIPKKIYTPDFEIIWDYEKFKKTKLANIFHVYKTKSTNEYYSIAETKGSWDRNNMTRLFKNNQAFIYEKYKIVVGLYKIPTLFEKTFTPQKYIFTDISGKFRKINFKIITLKEYLK